MTEPGWWPEEKKIKTNAVWLTPESYMNPSEILFWTPKNPWKRERWRQLPLKHRSLRTNILDTDNSVVTGGGWGMQVEEGIKGIYDDGEKHFKK